MKYLPLFKRDIFPCTICLIVGLYFFFFNIIGLKFTHYPGDLGDGRLNNYFLEHAHKFINGQEKSFWNAPFMYPEKNVLTYSDNLLGTVPIYSFFRILNFDRETSYQLWYLAMTILSFAACYIFLKILFRNPYSAAFGAMIFTFSMALQSQLTHAQTFPRFAVPLAFAAIVLFIKDFKPRYFFLILFFVVYEIYCGIYLGMMLMVPVFLSLLLILVLYRKNLIVHMKNPKWLILMGLSFIVNLAILLPLVKPYYDRARSMWTNSYEYVLQSVPKISSYLFSQKGSLLWDFLSEHSSDLPAHWDHQIFAGGIATAGFLTLSVLIIISPLSGNKLKIIELKKVSLIIFLAGIINFFLFVRFSNFSLYWLIYHIPGFSAMHSQTRIINVELLFFATSAAFLMNIILKKYSGYSMIIFLVFISLFTIDNYFKKGSSYISEKSESQTRVEGLIEKMKNIPQYSVISYEPTDGKDNIVACQLDAMLAAQSLNLISINGYTATSPATFTNYWINPDSVTRKAWLEANQKQDTKIYVIH